MSPSPASQLARQQQQTQPTLASCRGPRQGKKKKQTAVAAALTQKQPSVQLPLCPSPVTCCPSCPEKQQCFPAASKQCSPHLLLLFAPLRPPLLARLFTLDPPFPIASTLHLLFALSINLRQSCLPLTLLSSTALPVPVSYPSLPAFLLFHLLSPLPCTRTAMSIALCNSHGCQSVYS
jgi:hypothetical protein